MAALAILGVVGGCVGPAIEVVKWISAPIRRQCSYLCCLGSNIKTLEDEAKILDDVTTDLQNKIDPAENNAQLILSTVDTWVKDSVKAKTETEQILDAAPNVGSGCLKLGERYSLSRKAKKKTIAIKELVEKCKFTEISHPPPPAATAPIESGTTTYEFDSRRQIEQEIMKSLGNKNVYQIGISGMGGLGKTTMAKKIMNRALKEGLFDEVVMAVVSQPVDKLNIQLQIAGTLDLKFENDILISRANVLRTRLRGNKRVLLVLDDVWESLNMVELGIPCEDGCKVLITSRNTGVLGAMNVDKVCQLKILDEEEAWILFRGKAGNCVDFALLNPIVKDVMRECKGLPLALEIVGLALKDESNVSIWEDALGQLRRANPEIPSIIEMVYNHLKLSYDRLGNPNAKSLFLLCCLFPEDYDIPLKRLAYFATGLHLYQDIQELREVRGRTSALVKMLKTRGLLLDGSDEGHMRMHDVARDVSIFIASKEGKVKGSDCAWISSHIGGGARLNNVPPLEPCFPKLKLLLINDRDEEEETEINEDKLIGGSTNLNVLFIEDYGLLKSLPQLSTSIATLALYNCDLLESIAVVGQLKSLEILIFSVCYSIKELPEQVRGLKRLKRLQISRCPYLKRVAVGVISSMVALEELKIVESFRNWKGGEINIEEGNEASLREIESLKKLRCLDIEVSDIALAAQPLLLPSTLLRFRAHFGGYSYLPKGDYQRTMSLDFEGVKNDINWGDMSENIFLTRTEFLYAHGRNQDFNLNLARAQSIRWLMLRDVTNMKNIASAAAAFPLLEILCLANLPNLEEIWDDDASISSNSFTNLKILELSNMSALKRMGKSVSSAAKDFFLQLESIDIGGCEEMEHLVLVPDEEEQDKCKEDDITLLFAELKTLVLSNLPKLSSLICSGRIESIQFPLLARLFIRGCQNLRWLVSRDDDHSQDDDDDDSLHLFCHRKVSFPNVKMLRVERMESKNIWCDKVPFAFFTGLVGLYIGDCSKIRRLFSSSEIPQNLVNLQKLWIYNCTKMVKLIEGEDVSSFNHTTKCSPIFPSLQSLYLGKLSKLESFCEWRCDVELPSLKMLEIDRCHEMRSFNAGGSLVIQPALEPIITIDHKKLEYVDDLNAALQQNVEEAKRQREEEEELEEEEEEEEDDEAAAAEEAEEEARYQLTRSWAMGLK